MRRVLLALVLAVAVGVALSACGDDDDTIATSPTETADGVTTTEAEVAATTPTTATADEPAYEFAVMADTNLAPWFMPTPVDSDTTYVYPGQVVRLLFIELDPGGDACPTEAEIEVTDAGGAVVTTGSGSEIEIPEGDLEGPLTITVRCDRNGEAGVGILEPVGVAELLDVTVTPTTIVTGESVSVELAEGCPEGLDGRLGLTPEEGGGFGVLGETPALGADGTGELTVPEGATGTFYATVQCFDGETMAVGFASFEATLS
ncbi:MAG: hypothetical protein ACERLM_11820 [Acidimicrobiales bacterium]